MAKQMDGLMCREGSAIAGPWELGLGKMSFFHHLLSFPSPSEHHLHIHQLAVRNGGERYSLSEIGT